MRLLLDENLPRQIKTEFAEHEIHTIRDKGRNSIENWAVAATDGRK